jgi:hypothetical protein
LSIRHANKGSIALALSAGLVCSAVYAKAFVSVLWLMFEPLMPLDWMNWLPNVTSMQRSESSLAEEILALQTVPAGLQGH